MMKKLKCFNRKINMFLAMRVSYDVLPLRRETGTFNGFAKILGAGLTPKHRQRNHYKFVETF